MASVQIHRLDNYSSQVPSTRPGCWQRTEPKHLMPESKGSALKRSLAKTATLDQCLELQMATLDLEQQEGSNRVPLAIGLYPMSTQYRQKIAHQLSVNRY